MRAAFLEYSRLLMSNSTASDLAIRFTAVSYTPPGSGTAVLDQFSAQIPVGEVLALLGESGAGKSTVLRLCNRLLEPTGGSIQILGRGATEWDAIELRRNLGYVLQNDGLFPHFSVRENIELVPALLGWEAPRRDARMRELLEMVRLPLSLANRLPAELSGGQRQRVGIARALGASPPILLLDEPFGRLDPLTREQLRADFSALCKQLKTTVIFVTHDLREALLVGHRVALLRGGHLVEQGTPSQFLTSRDPDVRAYLATLEMPENLREQGSPAL